MKINKLFQFDVEKSKHYKKQIIGVDEVGRGCLAGSVVAAAAQIDFEKFQSLSSAQKDLFDDSKKLTPAKRQKALECSKKFVVCSSIAEVNADEIDRINILKASLLAMLKAIEGLGLRSAENIVLVDGNQLIPDLSFQQETIIKGDASSISIAVASILAKEFRDQYMKDMDLRYPGYGFAKHVGYGTKFHNEKLIELGPCVIHRKSFAPVRRALLQ